MKAYAIMKSLTGRHGTSDAEWEAFRQYAMDPDNGLPASGGTMLSLPHRDEDGDKVRKRFHHLHLDSLKKDQETLTKEGLASAVQKRKRAANDSDEYAAPLRLMNNPGEPVRVVLVDPDKDTDLQGNTGQFKWATASTKQIVVLNGITVAAVINSIESRIPNGRHVRAVYGAVAKPPADRKEPDDTEQITSDEDLRNFLEVTRGVYKPITFQLQLNKTGSHSETPSPDGRQYFTKDEFPVTIPEEPYNPVTSDSDNELYLINFGRKKQKHGRVVTMGMSMRKQNAGDG